MRQGREDQGRVKGKTRPIWQSMARQTRYVTRSVTIYGHACRGEGSSGDLDASASVQVRRWGYFAKRPESHQEIVHKIRYIATCSYAKLMYGARSESIRHGRRD